jgi:F-type H+-transporting ATPase subunit delta
VSTSEAQVIARALYDAVNGRALDLLRTAAAQVTDGRVETLETFLKSAQVNSPETRNLLLALAQDGRLNQLGAVVGAFEGMVQSSGRGLSGEITSAEELTESQRAAIVSDLRAKHGQGLELAFRVDPSLIGGLIIRVGDQVLDNSLRTRLSAVQRNMLAS